MRFGAAAFQSARTDWNTLAGVPTGTDGSATDTALVVVRTWAAPTAAPLPSGFGADALSACHAGVPATPGPPAFDPQHGHRVPRRCRPVPG